MGAFLISCLDSPRKATTLDAGRNITLFTATALSEETPGQQNEAKALLKNDFVKLY